MCCYVPPSTALYCTALCCPVLKSAAMYRPVPSCTAMYHTVLPCTALHLKRAHLGRCHPTVTVTVPHCHCTAPSLYRTVTVPHRPVLHPHCTAPSLYRTALYYTLTLPHCHCTAPPCTAGAHTVGRCHPERSGFSGPWTNAPTTFSNLYFTELTQNKWCVRGATYCTALHCTGLDWTGLDCTALHCTVLHCTVLYCIALYCTVLH